MQMRKDTDLIFIVGNSRSGTTMLARILGLSSQVHSFNELHYIEQMVSGEDFSSSVSVARNEAINLMANLFSVAEQGYFAKREPKAYFHKAVSLIESMSELTYSGILRTAMLDIAASNGKQLACEQTPRNVFYIPEILARYPEAVVVNMVRDPRDIVLSQKNKWKRRKLGGAIPRFEAMRSWMNYHPYTMARIWVMAVASALRSDQNPRVLTVRYEDLVSEPEETLKKITYHCDIPFESALLNVPQLGSSSRTDQGLIGIDRSRLNAWKKGGLSNAEVTICEDVCGPLMARFGYEPSGVKSKRLSLVFQYLLFPFKLSGALFLNFRRIRSLPSWLKQRLAARRQESL